MALNHTRLGFGHAETLKHLVKRLEKRLKCKAIFHDDIDSSAVFVVWKVRRDYTYRRNLAHVNVHARRDLCECLNCLLFAKHDHTPIIIR